MEQMFLFLFLFLLLILKKGGIQVILEEYIKVKVGSNASYYKNLGYEANHGEELWVKNEDAPHAMRGKEKRKCDLCGKEEYRYRVKWFDSQQWYGMDLCGQCSRDKGKEKKEATCLEKYGVKYPLQSKKIKAKSVASTKEKYGVESLFSLPEIQEVIQEEREKKYGVRNPNQRPEVREKTKKTNLERYGCENVFSSPIIKEKIKDTLQRNYGVSYISQSEEIKEKVRKTCQEKFGVDSSLSSKEVREKGKKTCLQKYGYESPMKNPEIKAKVQKTLSSSGKVPTSQQQKALFELCKENFNDWEVSLNVVESPFILDVVLTKGENKIDLEYDGSFWHQDSQKDRRRDEVIKRRGYKILRVKSGRLLPSVEQLREAILYLLREENHVFSQIILLDWKN